MNTVEGKLVVIVLSGHQFEWTLELSAVSKESDFVVFAAVHL